MTADALNDRWMPRSRAILLRQRASDRCIEEKRVTEDADRDARRKALPGYSGDNPEGMQGALRIR